MENTAVVRDPGMIASEINYIKEQTKRQVLIASMEIGQKLCEAKDLVPHGEWEAWLAENVDYSQSTANNLMRIYREYGSEQISLFSGKTPAEVFGELTYTQAVVLLGWPMEERMELAEEKDLSAMSSRELEREVEARKAAEAKAEEVEAELSTAKAKEQMLRDQIAQLERDIRDLTEPGDSIKPEDDAEQISMEDYILKADADAAIEAAKAEAQKKIDKARDAEKKAREEIAAAEEASAAKVRAAYDAALEEARQKRAELERQLETAANPAVQRFSIYFESLKEDFEKLCACVEDAEEADRERLRAGVIKVLDAMRGALEL